ncbi:hypothetical protein BBSC_1773 [Bifidobacterium scardovii JCM 12489 = DSM 13734]|nr:hypothetical protein BBSC_1773 [Bifidobacterium scardovii JCM 12489 = DSM 13734]
MRWLILAPLSGGSCRRSRLRGECPNRLDSSIRGNAPLRPLRGQLPSERGARITTNQ